MFVVNLNLPMPSIRGREAGVNEQKTTGEDKIFSIYVVNDKYEFSVRNFSYSYNCHSISRPVMLPSLLV